MGGKEPEYDFPELKEPEAAKPAVSEEEEDIEVPVLRDYKPEDIRALEREGKITREFLQRFQVRKVDKPEHRNYNLLKIATALGISVSRKEPLPSKKEVIDLILGNVKK